MKIYQNLTLVGTSHISQQSVQEVTQAIETIHPEIVALELDQTRFAGLLQKKKRKISFSDILKIGVKGYLFALIGAYMQKKLGKIVNMEPGSEMKVAIELARAKKMKIALVDQPIEITLKRFSQEFTWKEKFRILADIFRGIFFRKKEMQKYGVVSFDLTKVPEEKLIQKLIKQLKKRYPNIYKVLVQERNEVLAKNLSELIKREPESKIVAVVGAGHETEIIKLIKKHLGSGLEKKQPNIELEKKHLSM